jgi:hypothetical protein
MKKIDLLFDTDIGADCDDVMALAYLVYARRNLGLDIKAISISNGTPYAVSAVRAFFEDLGEEIPNIASPAGEVKTYDGYCKLICERFGSVKEPMAAENAVTVMRKALVESENAVICAVGAFTNVAALLNSKPDGISSLDGVSLVREKCSKVVLMAGIFDKNTDRVEWNVHLDVAATQSVVKLCPVPLYFLPSETGIGILTGAPAIAKYGDRTPLSASFLSRRDVRESGTRPSWDPASAVYAIEGCRDFLEESDNGTILVSDEGKTSFEPFENGKHRIIYLRGVGTDLENTSKTLAAQYIDNCSLEVYGDR